MDNRIAWMDIAKGLGISLVVAYHTLEGIKNSFEVTPLWVNAVASFFTLWLMPMFFIVSGYLGHFSLERTDRVGFIRKLANWIYIYVLWSVIIYSIRLVLNGMTNTTMQADEILHILWDPVPTIWFIYALLLSYAITWLVRHVSPVVVLSVSLAVNLLNGYFFGWFSGSIVERLCWIYFFYACGHFAAPVVVRIAENRRLYLLSALVLAGALALEFWLQPVVPFYAKFAISVVMAMAFLNLCHAAGQWFGEAGPVALFTYIGSISLFVYLTHFPIPGGVRFVLLHTGIYSHIALVILAVTGALVAGHLGKQISTRGWGRYLFEVPPIVVPAIKTS